MTANKNRRDNLVSQLKDLDDTEPFEFVYSLENTNDLLFVSEEEYGEDSSIYYILNITIKENSYSVKHNIKDDNNIINIEQEFLEDPEDVVDYVINKINQY